MIKTGRFLLLISFLILFFEASALAEVTVTATVDRNQVSLGDSFTLKVNVSAGRSVPVDPPGLPVIADVQLVHQWTSSQSKSSVVSTPQGMDFKTIISKIYSYQFATTKVGEILIDAIKVQAGEQTFATDPIKIQVLDGQVAPRPQANQQPQVQPTVPQNPIDEMEERFNQLLNRHFGRSRGQSYMTEPPKGKDAFFILAEVDKTEAFKGEQILASWYLYTRGRVRDIDTLKYPTLKGFWKEDIQISTHLNFEQDVLNGIPYNRALLASYALFPIEEGKQSIDPYKAKATIVGGLGFGRGRSQTKSSSNIPILIKPLPVDGKPSDFTGAVGEFQMTVDAPNKSIITHQPFPLRIRFEGSGNAKLIELPELPLGETLEVYDIKNESKFFKNGQSFKEFEVLLIPSQEGDLTIGSLKSSFFDPVKQEYVALTSDPINLSVLPGTKQQSIGEERLKADQKKKALPGVMKEWDPTFKASSSKNYIWIFAYALALIVLLGKYIIDSGLFQKDPSIEEVIALRFGRIDKMLGKSMTRKVGIEATNTVYQVLGELSGEGGSNEELEKVLAKTAPSVRREIESPLRKMMDFFGVLGFGPDEFVKQYSKKDELKKNLSELKKLLLKACSLSKGTSDAKKS